MYSLENFPEKLKIAREYRGYKTQAKICHELGIPKQSWNLWERDFRLPGFRDIVDICSKLKISILFFVSKTRDITRFDEEYYINETFSLPFVKTDIVRKTELFLNLAAGTQGVYLIETPGAIGISRAIAQWQKNAKEIPLIIMDHAYDMTAEKMAQIINTNREQSIVFICKSGTNHSALGINFTKHLTFNMIGYQDFTNIIIKALPGVPLAIITLLISESIYSLTKLSLLIKEIHKKQRNVNWQLDFNSVMDLCESVRTNQHEKSGEF